MMSLGLVYGMMLSTLTEPEKKQIEKGKEKKDLDLKPKDYDMTEINKRNGLKLFNIEGAEIWALNEKNAIKKYNKYLK